MVHVCAWCERFLGFKEPVATPAITHGICSTCFARQLWEEAPVLVVTPEKEPMIPILQDLLRGVPEIRVVVERRRTEPAPLASDRGREPRMARTPVRSR